MISLLLVRVVRRGEISFRFPVLGVAVAPGTGLGGPMRPDATALMCVELFLDRPRAVFMEIDNVGA